MKVEKVQHKAALVGFDWDDIYDVFSKVEEEYEEVREAYELDFEGFIADKYAGEDVLEKLKKKILNCLTNTIH